MMMILPPLGGNSSGSEVVGFSGTCGTQCATKFQHADTTPLQLPLEGRESALASAR